MSEQEDGTLHQTKCHNGALQVSRLLTILVCSSLIILEMMIGKRLPSFLFAGGTITDKGSRRLMSDCVQASVGKRTGERKSGE